MNDEPRRSRVAGPDRLAAVHRLAPPEPEARAALDRLARIGAHLVNAGSCLISLLEEDREVVYGSHGPAGSSGSEDISPTHSYCAAVVESGAPLVVSDVSRHPPTRDSAALREHGVSAYLGVPLKDRAGHVLGALAAVHDEPRDWSPADVSLLQDHASSVMRELEALGRSGDAADADARVVKILESITDAFFALDRDWNFRYVNSAAEQLLCRSREELLGVSLWDAYPEVVGSTFEREHRRAITEGITAMFEEFYPPLDTWFSVCAYPSEDGLLVYFRDVTERRRADARYRILVEEAPYAVYALDRENRFTELNERAAALLGRDAAELIGRSVAEVVAPEDLPKAMESLGRKLEGDAVTTEMELHMLTGAGERRLVELRSTIMRDEGEIVGTHGIGRDITEERATERALRESQEQFRHIADNVREVFWIFTPDFSRTIYVNPAYEEVMGDPVERAYQEPLSFLEGVHEDDLPDLLAGMEQVAHQEVMEGVEFRKRRADGSTRWLLARGYPVPDESGVITRVVGTTQDITEQKRAESVLLDSERRLRQILDALPVGVILADDTGQLIWHNPALQRIWGEIRMVAADEYHYYRGWWPESGEMVQPPEWPLARALRGEEVSGAVLDIEAFDGTRKTVLGSATPLRTEDGGIVGALSVTEDITESRAREARQRLLATALDRLQEGVFLLKPGGELIYTNETFRRILGVDPKGPAPVRLSDLAPAGALREQRRHLRTALREGRWSGRIWRNRLSDGQKIPLDAIIGRVDQGSGEPVLFGIVKEASAEVEREQQLRRVERLASLGTLIGGVAHELNNPLHAIRNFADLMLLDPREGDDLEALEIIRREADRAAKIVSDLRLITRKTQESRELREPVDLNDVVRHVLKVRRYSLETSNIGVAEELVQGLPPVLANRGELEQVLLNLVVNAEQAMQAHDGELRLIVRTRPTRNGAAIQVEDTGPGIPAEHMDRIFDPFFTTKEPGEGTGLGLSLAHSIVTEHGGRIHVQSTVGDGASFHVELPGAQDAQSAPREPVERKAPTRQLRILVVDDEPAIRRVSVLFLEQLGHRVDTAAEGQQALRLIEEEEYDVILSDLRMPGLDGAELLDRLRGMGDDLVGKLVFVTGDAASSHADLLMGEADVPVLIKPLRLEELAAAVERASYPE